MTAARAHRHTQDPGPPRASLLLSRQTLNFAAGFGVGTAAAWRYVEETVALLAARAGQLARAIRVLQLCEA